MLVWGIPIYLDTVFCDSTNCRNDCGRLVTEEHREAARKSNLPISQLELCDENGEYQGEKFEN
jgi:hypothetical protein